MASQHQVPVILTRALAQSERFARSLPMAAQPVFSPLLRIESLGVPVDWQAFDGFIFTSENGVRAVDNPAPLKGKSAFCVGNRTAEVAGEAGFETLSARGNAEDLVAMITQQEPSGRLLHVHGVHVRTDVAERLSEHKINVQTVALYDQVAQPMSDDALAILKGKRSLVPLFSPRTAQLFADACPEARCAEIICFSAAISDALDGARYADVTTVSEPSGAAVLDEISCRVIG
jgi:uroporphyrinogen-III synthase